MKRITNIFLIVFFILAVIKSAEAQDMVNVSGKVRYSDNNEIVTRGIVKCFDPSGQLVSVGVIEPTGDYILGVIRALEEDLIAFPNIDNEMDYFPTGYPNKIDPAQFVSIVAMENTTGVDIYVLRGPGQQRPVVNPVIVSGLVLDNNKKAVKDAVVYIKQGEEYFGFGVTNSKGEYTIENAPVGDYILVAHKVGNESDSRNVTITEKGMEGFVLNVTSKTKATEIPGTFELSQNYPNPFNPSTGISYSIPKQGHVSLKVYNSAGEVVSELVNQNQNAGTYNVKFKAENLSSGVYFYRIESNGLADAKKMILVK